MAHPAKPTEQISQISQVGRLHIPMAFSRDRVHVLLSLDTEKTDLTGLGPGQYSLTVHADSSPEAGVTRIEPPSVQVQIISGKR